MSGALAALLHLMLLVLALSWRPLAGWEPPAETPLQVELEAEPPPPPVFEPEKHPAGELKASRAAPRAGPAVALDASRDYLPPHMPSAAPSGMTAPLPGDGRGEGAAGTGSGGAGTASGAGADAPAAAMSLGQPDWIVKPTPWEMQEVNPYRAMSEHVSGGATLACLVNARKRAHDCVVIRESPGNYGFGAAALRLAVLFRIKPPELDGRPRYDVRVRIPVFFENLK